MVIKQQSVLIVSYCYSGLKATVDFIEALKIVFRLLKIKSCLLLTHVITRLCGYGATYIRFYLSSDNIITPDNVYFFLYAFYLLLITEVHRHENMI